MKWILTLGCLIITLHSYAVTITCPDSADIRITQGWALTAQHNSIDWDGSLAKDRGGPGSLDSMDLLFADWLNGYVVRCNYTNANLSSIAPIKGFCSPKGESQKCDSASGCKVECEIPSTTKVTN